jgi:hypothetical protein
MYLLLRRFADRQSRVTGLHPDPCSKFHRAPANTTPASVGFARGAVGPRMSRASFLAIVALIRCTVEVECPHLARRPSSFSPGKSPAGLKRPHRRGELVGCFAYGERPGHVRVGHLFDSFAPPPSGTVPRGRCAGMMSRRWRRGRQRTGLKSRKFHRRPAASTYDCFQIFSCYVNDGDERIT